MAKNQTYLVNGMDCADCALKVEKGVRQIEGVNDVSLNYITRLLQVEGNVDPKVIRQRVSALGYDLEDDQAELVKPKTQANALVSFWKYLLSRGETRLALVGGGLILVSLLLKAAGLPLIYTNLVLAGALGIAGYPIARGAIANLWINRDFSINMLMTIAALGAALIGDITESATLIFLFAIAEALEGFTSDRARSVLGELSGLAPKVATHLTQSGEENILAVEALTPGDLILVRAGERIPMDGAVTGGRSAVNQAPITGESIPVEKVENDEVFAGTINGSGTLTVRVTRPASETTIQRVIRMIEDAQHLRAPTQRFIDQFSKYYTPAMVVLAILIASIPPLFFGQPFLSPATGGVGWLYRALALLVIACPCALVISAPVTVVSAITAAARRGVLFKGGVYLEGLAEVKAFAFDKTGTLTQGRPTVTNFRSVDCSDGESCEQCDSILAIASALEKRSTHPLASSVLEAAKARGVADLYPPALDVVALAGSGLQGQVNGKLATIGSHKLFDLSHPHQEQVCDWVNEAEAHGQTTMLVCDGDRVRGYIAVADTIRSESREMVVELKSLGKETIILTGDNPSAAKTVADQVGVSRVRSGLLPDQKVSSVQEIAHQFGSVAMIGDGINDAPALAAATIGIAMGGAGSDQAMETADVVLMGSDLRQLPYAVRLSSFARRLIRQNMAVSLATKLVFVTLTFFGLTTLWIAVAADMGVSLLVTLNGMRANRYQN